MASRTPKAPAGLGARGKRVWSQTVAQYELREDELGLLAELARSLDTLDRIDVELSKSPLMIPGSTGQARPNPLLSEARGQRMAAAQLFRSLGLSDADDVEDGQALPTPKQLRARRAAQARWGSHGP